jgi:hypothetical protein
MMLRMEHLFDEVETRCLGMTKPDSEVLQLLSAPKVGPGGLCIRGYYMWAVVCGCYCARCCIIVYKPPVRSCSCCLPRR